METLMLVSNPSRRKGVKRMATRRKARSAAQKAATRKMLAANRSRRRGKTSARKRRVKHRRHRNPIAAVAMNPRRRRRGRVHHVARKRRHRNPGARGGLMGNLMQSVMPAVWGAGGAITINVVSGLVMSKLPVPDALKSGYGKMAVDVLLAAALGTFGRGVLGNKASLMASGAMTVIAYNALAPLAAKVLPGMAGLPGQIEGLPGQIEGLGYYSPAQTFGNAEQELRGVDFYQPMNENDGEQVGEYTYA